MTKTPATLVISHWSFVIGSSAKRHVPDDLHARRAARRRDSRRHPSAPPPADHAGALGRDAVPRRVAAAAQTPQAAGPLAADAAPHGGRRGARAGAGPAGAGAGDG